MKTQVIDKYMGIYPIFNRMVVHKVLIFLAMFADSKSDAFTGVAVRVRPLVPSLKSVTYRYSAHPKLLTKNTALIESIIEWLHYSAIAPARLSFFLFSEMLLFQSLSSKENDHA